MATSSPLPEMIDPAEREAIVTPRAALLAVALAVVGGLVRYVAAGDDLWLDEIWSWMYAMRGPSVLDVLLLRDENNHFLNTWLMSLIGPRGDWSVYRLPNVLAGFGSVVLAWPINRPHGRPAALAGMALVAASYLLVHYASEARGYGLVVFFTLLAFLLLRRAMERPGRLRELAVSAACVFGALSQPVFVYSYASLVAWWAWWTRPWARHGAPGHDGRSRRARLVGGLCAFGPATAFMAWLYLVNLRARMNSGGPIYALGEVLAQTASLTVGGPLLGVGIFVGAAVAIILTIVALADRFRRGDREAVFFLCVVAVMPLGLLVVTLRSEIYPRYFVISVAFAELLLARLFARFWERGGRARMTASLVLAGVLVGNAMQVQRLISLTRGHYLAALDDMQRETRGAKLVISSDHDFRHKIILSFYQDYLSKEIVYLDRDHRSSAGVEWFIRHELHPRAVFEPTLVVDDVTYRLQKTYPYAGLSGWCWAIYRREPPRR